MKRTDEVCGDAEGDYQLAIGLPDLLISVTPLPSMMIEMPSLSPPSEEP